jgi:YD repeat-containing protein
MKTIFSLFLFLFSFLASFAQEFTPPDSAAIKKNKVKSVKIYYTGRGTEHLITQEYRYDKNGFRTYSREGTTAYYYAFTYTEKGQLASSIQRKLTGEMIQGQKMDYTVDGKLFHMQTFTERDTIRPSVTYTYDSAGKVVEENHFMNGTLIRNYKNEYDSANRIIHRIDSTPGKSVYETVNSKTIRQTYYNEKNELQENCLIYYSDKGRLAETVCTIGEKKNIYKVIYDNYGDDYHVLMNDKPIGKEAYVKWDSKFRWLMPRPTEEEFPLPYVDPVSQYEYRHQLTWDKKDNIRKDVVNCKYSMANCPEIQFDYEYTYW